MSNQDGYMRPAVLGGLASGFLSVIPIIQAGNCICCLWIVVGGVLASYLLADQRQGRIAAGDGAVVGLLSGLFAACFTTVVHLVTFPFFGMKMLRQNIEQMRKVPGMPSQFESFYNQILAGRGGAIILLIILGILVVSAITYSIFGTLGGLLGSALFGKKDQPLPPAPPVPPSPPSY